MNVFQLTKIIFLLSAGSAQAVNRNRKVSDKDCEPFLSSVRIEVSPMLLRVMCRTTNSTTLVVDCGTNIRYGRVAGLCSNSDLNIGKVSMSQPLLSSTITLQLVQAGQVLDTAKVALLSSEQLFNYRISVWGNKNTRFVLEIAKECRHSRNVDLIDSLKGVHNSVPVKSSQRLPVVRGNSQSLEPYRKFQQNHPQSPVNGHFGTPLISEYSLANKLENTQQTNRGKLSSQYGFLNTQKIQLTKKDNASIDVKSKKIEIYRSKLLKPSLIKTTSPRNFRFHYNKIDSEENGTTTPAAESSELAKLRWMEEKRIIFEKKMKFLRNFNPETDGSTLSDTEHLSLEEDEEPTEISSLHLSKTSERLPSFDLHKSTDVPASSSDSFKHNKAVGVPHAFRGVQIQPTVKYYPITKDQSRSTEKIPRLMNEAATTKMRHRELKLRLLDSSNVHVQQNNDAKFVRSIPAIRPSSQSIVENAEIVGNTENAVFLPPVTTLDAAFNKPQEIHLRNAKPDNTKTDLRELNYTSAGFYKTVHTFTGDMGPSTVLTQPLGQNEKSVQTAQTLSQSKDKIAKNAILLHTSPMNITNPVLKYFKSVKPFVEYLTATPTSKIISTFLPRLTNSQGTQSVTVSNSEVEIRRTVFQELLTTVPVTVSTVRFEKPSQLQSMVSQNLHKFVQRTLKDGFETPALKTSTDGGTYAQTLSTDRPTLFTRSTHYTLIDGKTNSIVNNLSEKFSSQQQTSFISSPANSPYMKLGSTSSNNEKVNTPSTNTSLRPIIKSPSSLPDGHPDPSSSPTQLSYPRSEPLKMTLSNAQQPLIPSRYFNTDYTKAISLPPALQKEPKQEYRTTHKNINETTTTSQMKRNKTSLFMSEKIKRAPVMVEDREFEGLSASDVQTSSALPEAVPRNTSVQEKEESEATSQSPQDVNTSAFPDSVQTSTTAALDHPETTEPLELPETSQAPTNTGTPQASDKELEDMERDSFWPIVAALVIGIPTLVVLAIAIAVIHRKSKTDPIKLFHMKALRDSRHTSVLALHAEATERRRQDSVGTFMQETMVTPRREAPRRLSQVIPRPMSIDV